MRDIMDRLHRAKETNYPVYLAALCLLKSSNCGKNPIIETEILDATHGDLKRAIKALRTSQRETQTFSDVYETAIQFIRLNLLSRES